jgi:glycosyltransferase involved in cell wall biosynthesis
VKIIFLAPRYHTNQVGIVNSLLEERHAVIFHVVTIGQTEDHSSLQPRVIPESWFSYKIRLIFGDGGVNKLRYFPNPFYYFKILLSENADIIIIRLHNTYFVLIASIVARILGIKIIFYDQVQKSDFYRFFVSKRNFIRRLAFKIIMKTFNAKFYSPLFFDLHSPPFLLKECYYLPFVLNTSKPSKLFMQDEVRIVMVAKFQERKNHLLLIDALKHFQNKYSFKLTLVGEASTNRHLEQYEKVLKRIRCYGMENQVKIYLNISYSKMDNIYSDNDLFILPSNNEPASISVLEAMSFGLPVICSDSCGTSIFIKDGFNGYIFKSDNLGSLIMKMEFIFSDKQLLGKMKINSIDFAKKEFSKEVFFSYFNKLIT